MKKKRGLLIGCGTGIVLLLIGLVTAGVWFLSNLPEADVQAPMSPVLVDIVFPENGLETRLDNAVPVSVQAISSRPITHLELWADGQLYGSADDASEFQWTWQAETAGIHTLVARGRDVQDQTGQSQIIVLNVLPRSVQEIKAIKGQTLEVIGDQYGIAAEDIAAANPALDPKQPLDGQQEVKIPSGDGGKKNNAPNPPSGQPEPPQPPPDPFWFWLNKNILQAAKPASPPDAPDLALKYEKCKLQLFVTPHSDNQSGFILYRWRTGESGFNKIAVLGAGTNGVPTLYADPAPIAGGMQSLYYAEAYNAGGKALSQIVGYSADAEQCPAAGQNEPTYLIKINFVLKENVDKTYCYWFGGNKWQRIPAEDFDFFGKFDDISKGIPLEIGAEKPATQQILLDCWGWSDGALKYLGQGQANFDVNQPPKEIILDASGFHAAGIPALKPLKDDGESPAELKNLVVPPPFALREPENTAECASHGFPVGGQLVCDQLLNSKVKQYITLVWEWKPGACWAGECKWWNNIDGFHIYKVDAITKNTTPVKTIANSKQMVTAIPLSWGSVCYAVRAFANHPSAGELLSAPVSYCPGQLPAPKKIILQPIDWLTTADDWIYDGCEDTGQAWPWKPLGIEVVVGGLEVNSDDCGLQSRSAGAVLFDIPAMKLSQPLAVIQKATLLFHNRSTDYSVYFGEDKGYVATNQKPLCATRLGISKVDWKGWSPSNHFSFDQSMLDHPANIAPYTAIKPFNYSIDVTSAVQTWFKKPDTNRGFVLYPTSLDLAYYFYSNAENQRCMSNLNDFKLEILYFTPAE
ncbi:MAG: hypothetical protein HPY59_01825 [Anaerolineae bacterium]|nr:hypothetical protein [Anaerolineae bacterium]